MRYDQPSDEIASECSIGRRIYSFLLSENWTDGSLLSLKQDIVSGLTLAVTQVAPSIGFALIAGGPPLYGLFSSFFLGVFSCILGGRPGQITAIAGAVVVLYPPLVEKHGYDAICVVSVFTGFLLIVLGVLRVSKYVTLLPATLMVGFCCGLCVSMIMHQIDSFRNQYGNYPVGLEAVYVSILVIFTYGVMMLLPLFTTVLPSTFVAIILGTALNYVFQMGTCTIGDLYVLKGDFPPPKIPQVNWSSGDFWKDVIVSSFLTFIITSIESFMSGYKIQQMTETPTNFDREALGIGAAFIINGFFQGMPGCVVFGPSVLNIDNGTGTRRLAGLICAVLMAIFPLALYPVIRYLPMGVLSGVVFGVSSKTADWRMLAMIFLQRISFQEALVAITVTVTTVVSNLALATGVGFGVALLFFMWSMSRGRLLLTPHGAREEEFCKENDSGFPPLSAAESFPNQLDTSFPYGRCDDRKTQNKLTSRELKTREGILTSEEELRCQRLKDNSTRAFVDPAEGVLEESTPPNYFSDPLSLHTSKCHSKNTYKSDLPSSKRIVFEKRESVDQGRCSISGKLIISSLGFSMEDGMEMIEEEKREGEVEGVIHTGINAARSPHLSSSSQESRELVKEEQEGLNGQMRRDEHEMLYDDLWERPFSETSDCNKIAETSVCWSSSCGAEEGRQRSGNRVLRSESNESIGKDEKRTSAKETVSKDLNKCGEMCKLSEERELCLFPLSEDEKDNIMQEHGILDLEKFQRRSAGESSDLLDDEEGGSSGHVVSITECEDCGTAEKLQNPLPVDFTSSFSREYLSGFMVPNSSMIPQSFHLDIHFLHIEVDPIFPQVKVLRVKLNGVLFFGSCTEFVEKMMKMVHIYHPYLFLRVTDMIFDFQDGLMPVIDYSGGEALEVAASTLAKRGIRVHLQHLDPLSELCVERARRYFPHVSEDNVDNVKHLCYTRRIFKRGFLEHRDISSSFDSLGNEDGLLDDDIFLRVNKPTDDEPRSPNSLTSVLISPPFLQTIKIGFPLYLQSFGITVPVFHLLKDWQEMANRSESGASGRSHSVQEESLRFPIFPHLNDITLGITDKMPFDRRFGEFSHVWWDRLRGRDLKKPMPQRAYNRDFAGRTPSLVVGNPRPPPQCFIQLPRFPGQDFAKNETFSRVEQEMVQKAVLHLWGIEEDPHPPPHFFRRHLVRMANAYIDGFL